MEAEPFFALSFSLLERLIFRSRGISSISVINNFCRIFLDKIFIKERGILPEQSEELKEKYKICRALAKMLMFRTQI